MNSRKSFSNPDASQCVLIYTILLIRHIRRRIPPLRKLLGPIALFVIFTNCLYASDNTGPLTIELSEPSLRITIPGMPEIAMGVHPMNEHKPNFRLLGDSGRISVSVITPNIDGAITPMSCASAIANLILSLHDVTREQLFLGRANEETFLIIYGLPMENGVLLNTHIVSSVKANQCIEARVSKTSTSDSDIEPWFSSFGDSDIKAL